MKKSKFFTLAILFSISVASLWANTRYPAPSDIVKQYYAAIDGGNTADMEKLLSEDFQGNAPFAPQALPKQAWLGVGQGFKAAFPDMRHEVVNTFESGFNVSVRGVFMGKNDGPMMGNPATGNYVNVPFNAIFELDKAWKIKALFVQFDQKAFDSQLMAGLPKAAAAAETTVRGIMAAADAGDTEKLISYFSPDAKHYFSGVANTHEELKKRVTGLKAGFPDIKRNLNVISNANGTVAVQGWLEGTNSGPFMGQPATGKKIRISALGVYQINASGKVVEAWIELDTASLWSQLRGESTASGK